MSLFDNVLKLLGAKRPVIEERVKLATQAMEEAKQSAIKDLLRPTVGEKNIGAFWFSDIQYFDLGTAHTNKLIWNRPGKSLFIIECDGQPANTHIRFNSVNSSKYPVLTGHIKSIFNQIYLTNTAQAGKILKFVVSSNPLAEYHITGRAETLLADIETWTEFLKLNSLRPPTKGVDYMEVITNADQEYSKVIGGAGEAVRELRFNLADFATFRYAWVTGKVAAPTAPYITVPANTPVVFHNIALYATTLYFADSIGTKVMCISTMEDSP